jgi:hypothetical protein
MPRFSSSTIAVASFVVWFPFTQSLIETRPFDQSQNVAKSIYLFRTIIAFSEWFDVSYSFQQTPMLILMISLRANVNSRTMTTSFAWWMVVVAVAIILIFAGFVVFFVVRRRDNPFQPPVEKVKPASTVTFDEIQEGEIECENPLALDDPGSGSIIPSVFVLRATTCSRWKSVPGLRFFISLPI